MSDSSTKVAAIIPARYGSTRFPGKPLALIDGSPMIQHVYERVSQAKRVNEVYVATDDRRIADAVEAFGGKVVMTPSALRSGTDRCAVAAKKIRAGLIVNVQGDEPTISPATVDATVAILARSRDTVMSTAAVPVRSEDALFSQNVVKVVVDNKGDALYFSRNAIPFIRDAARKDYMGKFRFLKHLGIYAYRNSFLQKLSKMKATSLEEAEKLEQLRVLENGFRIRVAIVAEDTVSVDVPSDIIAVEKHIDDTTLTDERAGLGKA